MAIEPASLDALRALCLGAALSGLLASAVEFATARPVGFRLLHAGNWTALASVPLLVFAAPFLIVRFFVRDGRSPVPAVVIGTALAGGWSLLCGRLALDAVALLAGA